jgi:ubiquinone/menaquinone biosynthesis C-methylase UbiE
MALLTILMMDASLPSPVTRLTVSNAEKLDIDCRQARRISMMAHKFSGSKEANELARRFLSDERRRYQNPLKISKALGVKKGMTLADLGCGPGFFTIPLASLVGSRGLVYAVDSSPTMLKHLRTNIKNSHASGMSIKIVRANVSRTGIPSNSVDIVLFARLLHDIGNKRAFLKEVKRICKPGGVVIDLDWKKIRMKHGPPYGICLNKPQARRIVTRRGFRFVSTFDAGRYHYGLIFRPRT